LQDNFFNLNASFKSDKGILFFGGNNGLNYIKPNERQASKNFYPIMLTDLKIFNQSFRELPKSEREAITSQSLDHSNVITLSHDKNNFTLEFAVLNYAARVKTCWRISLRDTITIGYIPIIKNLCTL